MPFKPKEREYRALMMPLAAINSEKRIESDYYVEGLATTFEPYELYEHDGVKFYEQVDKNAFDGADMTDVIFQFDHCGKVLARNSNNTLGIEPTNKGLFIYADLSKSEAAKEMYREIDSGLVTKMSFAFTIEEDSYNRELRTRTILKIKKVYDVSAVSIPANASTDISARSYFDGVIEAQKQELLERRKRILSIKLSMEV